MAGSALRLLRRERLAALSDADVGERALLSIVEAVSSGGTFGGICEEHGLSWTEMLMWLQGDEGRWGHFLKAHEARAVHLVSEVVGIADTPRVGEVRKLLPDGTEQVTIEDMLGHRKLQIETRLKIAQHHAPGLYGKVVRHEHSAVGDLGERLRRARERVIEPEALRELSEKANGETPLDQQTDSVAAPNQGEVGVDTPERRG